MRKCLALFFILVFKFLVAQLPVGVDTIQVIDNNKSLKLTWAGGLNSCLFSELDLNNDNKNDLIAFDKVNNFSYGIFRCFINEGNTGEIKYKYNNQYNKLFPEVKHWAYFYDYNNDGKNDLFTYTLGGIKVYKNTSAATLSFTLEKTILYSNSTPSSTPNYGAIYSAAISLPGFSDIDNDGDMDILTFSAGGFQLEYHKNLSKELYNHADSLVFELSENTWGDFSESNCSVMLDQFRHNVNELNLHSGSCLTCFDRNGDGDKDLLLGDVACSNSLYLENTGTSSLAHMGDTTKLYPNYPNKASTQIIKLNSFPCGHYIDINNDAQKDLIVSPNAINSENFSSVWLYQNSSSTNTVNFQFTKNNFLQDEMLEHGEGAYPVLVDVDADGLLDLIVGNMGYYESGVLKSKLAFYKNTGTMSQPSYSLITRDYANVSAFATTNNLVGLVPTFGDIDSDGDKDLILTDFYGKIHWIENTSGAGNPFNFTLFKYNHFGITTPQGAPFAQLIDVDRDNLIDLLVGLRNGRLAFYKNTGTSSVPSFSLISATFGGVNVKGPPSLYSTDGSCAPFLFDDAGTYKLLCGSISGKIYYYDNIDGNLSGNFNLLDSVVNNINDGPRSALQYIDVNGDGKRDLFVGNHGGGLHFYSSKAPVGINEIQKNNSDYFFVYPNPAKNHVVVKFNSLKTKKVNAYLYNSMGQLIKTIIGESITFSINTESLNEGVYQLLIENVLEDNIKQIETKKVIIIK